MAGDQSLSTDLETTQPPVLAGGQSWRLATAGGDNNVRMWMIHPNIPSPAALAAASSDTTPHPPRTEYLATLARHTGVVNVVRFSPFGDMLASAGDDGNVLFWVRQDLSRNHFGQTPFSVSNVDGVHDKECWRVRLMTRTTPLELYDLAWSPDADFVAAGGTDFSVRLLRVSDGTVIREISDHQHYVQGIAWDPLHQYLATQSSDRFMHVYERQKEQDSSSIDMRIVSRNTRSDMQSRSVSEALSSVDAAAPAPAPAFSNVCTSAAASDAQLPPIDVPECSTCSQHAPSSISSDQAQKLYGDDRCTSFFRRLDFSPDGALLVTPTGQFYPLSATEAGSKNTPMSNAVYIYGRANLCRANVPIAALPGHKTTTIAVRFSPILYRLRSSSCSTSKSVPSTAQPSKDVSEAHTSSDTPRPTSMFGLPYRMIYAVATQESVWVYDTQQAGPLCCFSNLHYASFTDLAWSPDGQSLMMSSSDGYCSLAVFDYHELGRPYQYSDQPSLTRTPSRTSGSVAPIPSFEPAPAKLPASSTPSKDAEPKKKRRVALTYEGPLSSSQ